MILKHILNYFFVGFEFENISWFFLRSNSYAIEHHSIIFVTVIIPSNLSALITWQ